MLQMIQDDTDLSDESDYRKSIFNHLQSSQQNETKTNKTALKYTTKKEKTPTFGWSHVDDADGTRWYRSFWYDYHKSIFNLFNHLQSSQQNETKPNKTALKYITKKQKTPRWSHVDDADDTDDTDRSVTDGQTDRRTNNGLWRSSTEKS